MDHTVCFRIKSDIVDDFVSVTQYSEPGEMLTLVFYIIFGCFLGLDI